jgi:hypothetical protein
VSRQSAPAAITRAAELVGLIKGAMKCNLERRGKLGDFAGTRNIDAAIRQQDPDRHTGRAKRARLNRLLLDQFKLVV